MPDAPGDAEATSEPSDAELLDGEPSRWPTIIGGCSIAYAVGGLLCQAGAGVSTLASEWLMSLGGMEIETPPALKIIGGANVVILSILGIVMLVGAVRLLKRRRSGVTLLRRWAMIRLVLVLVGALTSIALMDAQLDMQEQIIEATNAKLIEAGRADSVQEFDEQQVWRRQVLMLGVFSVLLAVYPLFIGFSLSRKKIVEEASTWTP